MINLLLLFLLLYISLLFLFGYIDGFKTRSRFWSMFYYIGNIVMYILNIKNRTRKNVAGYTILLSPMMSIFCGIYMAYITSGFRYYGLSSIGGLIGMYLAVLVMSTREYSFSISEKIYYS